MDGHGGLEETIRLLVRASCLGYERTGMDDGDTRPPARQRRSALFQPADHALGVGNSAGLDVGGDSVSCPLDLAWLAQPHPDRRRLYLLIQSASVGEASFDQATPGPPVGEVQRGLPGTKRGDNGLCP